MTGSYLPHTDKDRDAMLSTIGVSSIAELFDDIPEQFRLQRNLILPAAMAEQELVRHMQGLARKNADLREFTCFLGAGAYDHYIPSVVDHIIRRSEFYTAYTQYQAEVAQGYLQAIWEYQSMICAITGMEVANASLYDGATAVAEAVMMACEVKTRKEVVVASSVHPHYRQVLQTYAADRGYQLKECRYTDGAIDIAQLTTMVNNETAAVVLQNPNFFGCIENVLTVAELSHAQDALLIVAADPVSLGILEAPGKLGADIVAGEGQGLGLPIAFGGPYLGFLAANEKLMRKLPGRIVGKTTDAKGNRGFVLTLQAREQHIRREKATSNICSNEALCALAAAVYMASVGKEGFQTIANLSLQKAHYAFERLTNLVGCEKVFRTPFYKEFVIHCSHPVSEINHALYADRIIGGLDLSRYYPDLENCMLLCVTEKRSKKEIDRLVSRLEAAL